MIDFEYPEGATPIDPDEAEGLLLPHIRTRAELDRWEQENIHEAEDTVFRRKQKDILTVLSTIQRLRLSKPAFDSSSELRTNCMLKQVYKLIQHRPCLHQDL